MFQQPAFQSRPKLFSASGPLPGDDRLKHYTHEAVTEVCFAGVGRTPVQRQGLLIVDDDGYWVQPARLPVLVRNFAKRHDVHVEFAAVHCSRDAVCIVTHGQHCHR